MALGENMVFGKNIILGENMVFVKNMTFDGNIVFAENIFKGYYLLSISQRLGSGICISNDLFPTPLPSTSSSSRSARAQYDALGG